jgi:ABC-type transporter Mla MlaB component
VWQRTRDEIKSQSSWWKHWRVDLAGVRFIDSTGIALMKRLKEYVPRKGARIDFVEPPEQVRTVLRQAGVEAVLLGEGERKVAVATRARANWLTRCFATLRSGARTSLRRLLRSGRGSPRPDRPPYARATQSLGGAA